MTRKRVFDVIQIGNREDFLSRLFDYFLSVVIITNIVVMFLLTFESFRTNLFVKRLEFITFVIFIIEYVLRIWTADYLYPDCTKGKAVLRFLISFDGVVEILTIIPFFAFSGFVAFRLLRVFRILHLFRLNARMDSFHIIADVVVAKRKEILSSLALLLMVMFASSLCLYSVEHEAQPDVFKNAFSGLWCSLSTILTVGYGDIYPVTQLGRIITGVFGVIGICVTAVLTGILSAGFIEKWNAEKDSEKTYYDIEDYGEIRATDEMIGKMVKELTDADTVQITMVLRDEMVLIPTPNLAIQENDILIGRFYRLKKRKKHRTR